MRCGIIGLLFLSLIIGLDTPGFADESAYPTDVAEALDKAGDNREELVKVIDYCRDSNDSLKLKAAYYLIANMEGHSYMVFGLFDSAKTEYTLDVISFANLDSLEASFDTMETNHPGLDFGKKELIDDLKTIKADFLITQIDLAFKAWREKPWANGMTFSDFCEYVLPYRGSNEPLEEWRGYFLEKYQDLQNKMNDPTDCIEATKLINQDVRSYFTFDSRFYYHPTDQGLSEMLDNHLGRCEDMTNIAIYAMRANGLAVTSDYTPFWANSGNNHAWNAILTATGKVVPFMGAEAEPGDYRLWNKLAKVYRKMYSKQKSNLIFQERKQEKVPGWLAGKSYIDVTSDYVKTADVNVQLTKATGDSIDIAYLCVFNSGEWQAIHWGKIKDNTVVFTAMGTDVAYLPAFYIAEEMVPAGKPFILDSTGVVRELLFANNDKSTIELISTTNRVQAISTDGIAKSFLVSGKEYELFYWNDNWESAGKVVATDKPILFNVPSGCLYWLVESESNREERIFTVENGRQIWW